MDTKEITAWSEFRRLERERRPTPAESRDELAAFQLANCIRLTAILDRGPGYRFRDSQSASMLVTFYNRPSCWAAHSRSAAGPCAVGAGRKLVRSTPETNS
jgi:hypothetical protein